MPDGRFTFDRERPTTTLEHLWHDLENGPDNSYESHLREWARTISHVAEPQLDDAVAALRASGYSIHFHVWDFEALEAMLRSLQTRGWALKLEALERNGEENIFVLRKI